MLIFHMTLLPVMLGRGRNRGPHAAGRVPGPTQARGCAACVFSRGARALMRLEGGQWTELLVLVLQNLQTEEHKARSVRATLNLI